MYEDYGDYVGRWVLTKGGKYGYVGFVDEDPKMAGNLYLYFFDTGNCRSYSPLKLTLVDKAISDVLNATYYKEIRMYV
jgi:hypothetical protein